MATLLGKRASHLALRLKYIVRKMFCAVFSFPLDVHVATVNLMSSIPDISFLTFHAYGSGFRLSDGSDVYLSSSYLFKAPYFGN